MSLVAHGLAGFVVAVLCTPAGVSGAFLLLPVQILLFGAPSPQVSATNLLYNVTATPAGVATFDRRGAVDRTLVVRLCAGSAPGVVLGVLARATFLAGEDRFAPVAAAVLLVLGGRLLMVRGDDPSGHRHADDLATGRLVALGFGAGVIGGIYGLGGAALVVPWLVSVERVDVREAAGPGLVVTLVTSVVGLTTFVLAGAPPAWAVGLALGVGGAAGAVVGARLQPRLPVRLLRTVLAIAALAAGLRLLI